jgi:hypothetical protein
MSTVYAGHRRLENDHFHPEAEEDPAVQRRRRGWLEQIDYTAFACSKEVVAHGIGRAGPAAFQGLALACAQARAAWVAEAFRLGGQVGGAADPAAIARLASLRTAYDELLHAYEAARRMVERGYLTYEAG